MTSKCPKNDLKRPQKWLQIQPQNVLKNDLKRPQKWPQKHPQNVLKNDLKRPQKWPQTQPQNILKNDLKIDDDLEGITFPSPDMLEFSEPRDVHEGRYHCTANNSMGLAVSEVILVAASKPIIADWWIIPKLTTQPLKDTHASSYQN